MNTRHTRQYQGIYPRGSALILTVVLTSMLAIVGVLYLLMSRMDRKASSAMAEGATLNIAVDTVVDRIAAVLVRDVPGVAGQEYQDYPGPNDPWLACLEPNEPNENGRWRRISDIYETGGAAFTNVEPLVVLERAPIDPNYPLADADGDGVADARWIGTGITDSKGRQVYAAVRVIDHGAMLNVNTAYTFDPCDFNDVSRDYSHIDGSQQMQIDLTYLAERGANSNPLDTLNGLRMTDPAQFSYDGYAGQVVWNYSDPPVLSYCPFDIVDELRLRYRYVLNRNSVVSRIDNLWLNTYKGGRGVPIEGTNNKWFDYVNAEPNEIPDPNYDFRHLSTTYNMDRVIDPTGQKMININRPLFVQSGMVDGYTRGLFNVLRGILGTARAAQWIVNMVDFWDEDSKPSIFTPSVIDANLTDVYYGLEPHPWISRISFRMAGSDPDVGSNNSFEIELLNPFPTDLNVEGLRIILTPHIPGSQDTVKTIDLPSRVMNGRSILIISNRATPLSGASTEVEVTPALGLATYQKTGTNTWALRTAYDVSLLTKTHVDGNDVALDGQITSDPWFAWNSNNTINHYCRTDSSVDPGHWYVLGSTMAAVSPDALGNRLNIIEGLNLPDPDHLGTRLDPNGVPLRQFCTVGDIARVLTIGPTPGETVKEQFDSAVIHDANGTPPRIQEGLIRLDIARPEVARLFRYLTVIDPSDYVYDPNRVETRIKGRININTAPWFVIARLPWIRHTEQWLDRNIAAEIVGQRDYSIHGFKSIAGLMQVPGVATAFIDGRNNLYKRIDADDPNEPDFTEDSAVDDFEERDLLFSRISNLVTVRSDVFSAYILVRIGLDGPQRRVLVILDRSQVDSLDDRVRIVAFQRVPDPR